MTALHLRRRLGMDAEAFVACADHFFRDFADAVGTPAKLIELAAHRQQRALRDWLRHGGCLRRKRHSTPAPRCFSS